MKQKLIERTGFFILFLCMVITVLFLGTVIYFIADRGIKVISWEFLTQVPRMGMT